MLGEVAELDTFARPISPLTGWSSPASSLISVDFPAPLRPSRPMREPGTRLSLMESRIIPLAVAGADFLHLQQRVRQTLWLAETGSGMGYLRAPGR